MIFEDDVELALVVACEELEMTRDESIRLFIREWLQQCGYLPVHELDEGSETKLRGSFHEHKGRECGLSVPPPRVCRSERRSDRSPCASAGDRIQASGGRAKCAQ